MPKLTCSVKQYHYINILIRITRQWVMDYVDVCILIETWTLKLKKMLIKNKKRSNSTPLKDARLFDNLGNQHKQEWDIGSINPNITPSDCKFATVSENQNFPLFEILWWGRIIKKKKWPKTQQNCSIEKI